MSDVVLETLEYMSCVVTKALKATEMPTIIKGTQVNIVSNSVLIVTYPGSLPACVTKVLNDLIGIYPAHLENKISEVNLTQYIITLADDDEVMLDKYMATIHELTNTYTLRKKVVVDLDVEILADNEEEANEIFESQVSISIPSLNVSCTSDALKGYTYDVSDIE